MKKVILILAAIISLISCKKNYNCECEYYERTCIQKTNVCKDSLINKTNENIGKLTNQQANNKCHNVQTMKTFHDSIVVYNITNCEVR